MCSTHLLSTKQKTSNLPHLCHFLPLPWLQFGALFKIKPLKSLLLACYHPRLLALPTAFGSPASRSVPRAHIQKDSPWRSERVGVIGDQSRKGRRDQRSRRISALKQNVRDEVKSSGLEILLTQTHRCTQALYTGFLILQIDSFLSLPIIIQISCSHYFQSNLPLIFPAHFNFIVDNVICWCKPATSVATLSAEVFVNCMS